MAAAHKKPTYWPAENASFTARENLFTQKPQRGGLTLVLPAEQLAHLPGQRVFRSSGIDEQFVHFKRRQFNRRKRHFLQEMFLFGKRDPHADKRTSEQFVRFPYAVNSP
ncbi:MAG: hypothetical protein ACLR0N_00935 [Bilophila wadsworthia]